MQLLIAGDLVPTESNTDLFNTADMNALLGEELYSILNSADMRIFNLEVPLTDKETPIDKCGPNLIAPISTIKGIKKLNPSLAILANNHIMDQGVHGLNSTREILENNKIPFVGVGDNLREASRGYIIETGKLKIGIYACAEYEFTIATEKVPGANPFDPLNSLDHISDLKAQCDYVIVIYHGGKEHYRYPSPYLQKVCRKMANKGADVIICQHSHCIGAYEKYEGSTIVYGQGNFLFDRSNSEFWKTSILVEININNGLFVNYIPIIKKGKGVCLATGQVADEIIEQFHLRSKKIENDDFVEERYLKFAKENSLTYIRSFAGFNKWIIRFDRYLLKDTIAKRKYNKKRLLSIQNFIECEAHRELVLQIIKGETNLGKE